jgi:hypothetical protein
MPARETSGVAKEDPKVISNSRPKKKKKKKKFVNHRIKGLTWNSWIIKLQRFSQRPVIEKDRM